MDVDGIFDVGSVCDVEFDRVRYGCGINECFMIVFGFCFFGDFECGWMM